MLVDAIPSPTMTQKRITRSSLWFVVVFALVGCASTGGSSSGNVDRDNIKRYAGQLTGQMVFQGAAIGTILGVTLSCVNNMSKGDSCAKNVGKAAAAGGVSAAALGYFAAASATKYSNNAARLEGLTSAAERELAEAIEVRRAAGRLVEASSDKLDRLASRAEASTDARRQLKIELAVSRSDIESMRKSLDRMADQRNKVREEVNGNIGGDTRVKLNASRESLQSELNRLQREIDVFTGVVEKAATILS